MAGKPKPKGRVPSSSSNSVVTVRFRSHTQMKAVSDYARNVLGVSVNEFCVEQLLKAVGYQNKNVERPDSQELGPSGVS